MRWIIVFILLYLIPLFILFRNYKNIKRSCIYASIYTVLATVICISNMYMSGIETIKESMYYPKYTDDEVYEPKDSTEKEGIDNKEEANSNEEDTDKSQREEAVEEKTFNEGGPSGDVTQEDTFTSHVIEEYEKSDIELINDFKKEVYEIEKEALIPMRECLPYTKDIQENLKKLGTIEEDLNYAKEMCNKVVESYEELEVPKLSQEEYNDKLYEAKEEVTKAYELREQSMESAIELLETKNVLHVGSITEYLELSDEHVEGFKEITVDLVDEIESKQALNNIEK